MTLAQWAEQAGITVYQTKAGAIYLDAEPRIRGFTDLWRLDDYAVSSRIGPRLYMVQRARTINLDDYVRGPREN